MTPSLQTEGGLQAGSGAAVRPAFAYFADSYHFHWELASFRTDWVFVLAVALGLAVGLAVGHPAAGMIVAGGAMTTGFGAKQSIDDTPLLPMIFVSIGMPMATFLGMLAGHRGWELTALTVAAGFGYGMLSKRQAGFSWVAQQCVVSLLVASAFPASAEDAVKRAGLIFAGCVLQLLIASVAMRHFGQLGRHVLSLARYVRSEEQQMRATYLSAVHDWRHRELRDSALPYAARLAAVLAISTEIYRALHFASGYWIPMTALLVLRPGVADTANRAVARTAGTLAGGVLTSFFLVYVHPPDAGLAVLVTLFTWLAYSVNNVNYALFSTCLTAYIVFLLSLNGTPSAEIARHRFVCTLLGGVIALAVRLVVIRLRQHQDWKSLHLQTQAGMAGTGGPP